MAHESFEDEEVAELLNKNYVSIKVDREERPDIDQLYMTVCQTLTGQGGWPLTIIMTPDKEPFFAGTYFPKKRWYGRIGLMEILSQIKEKWNNDREHVAEISQQIVQEVERRVGSARKGSLSEAILDKAFNHYKHTFDSVYGGFGEAPKFPTPHQLAFLMRYYDRAGEKKALEMVTTTLNAMHRGGIYDHIGFGFSRYSVDERWLVPHFEKMLYDNALLAWTYLEAFQLTKDNHFLTVAESILQYVLRDMAHAEGGFYSAEDADSEGEEGKFYVWKRDEIIELLGKEAGELYCELYDITDKGNFEGHNIPNLIQHDIAKFSEQQGIEVRELQERIERSRQKLFQYREGRVHPGKDDKILTAWNGLMIMAMAKGSIITGKHEYLETAERAVDFIRSNLIREDGRLLARYRDGDAAFPAYLDDYAFLVWGLMELYEASFKLEHLSLAIDLTHRMIDLFWDEQSGGFYFYGNDGEQLFARSKEIYDGAMPSGNSVAAYNLHKLARLTNDERIMNIARQQLEAFAGAVSSYPTGHAMYLIALDYAFSPSSEIVIAGELADSVTLQMLEAIRGGFRPHTSVIVVPSGDKKNMTKAIPLVQDKKQIGGKTTAYVCENFSCQSPTTDVEVLKTQLQK
ncbi:thioredoxin domain-containing protein [Paenibacillus sediminis]|uniref:Uncharacterized protein YyaL (SSP411 family) n=1 Tax=Paenibacillus sediminis TaxID=664909 RepID=A0ABS4H119_9BACL|nr:thioredoxin domain-containing protein [Paenibacillus sediminis]MBP1936225.1 uncharacterized protein YyaL (SSP411 family) [Paenibacillus sediminis]